jgi:hypothetical protein
MEAEIVFEMSKIFSKLIRLSARQGLSLSVAVKFQILIMQTLLFLAHSCYLQISLVAACASGWDLYHGTVPEGMQRKWKLS